MGRRGELPVAAPQQQQEEEGEETVEQFRKGLDALIEMGIPEQDAKGMMLFVGN